MQWVDLAVRWGARGVFGLPGREGEVGWDLGWMFYLQREVLRGNRGLFSEKMAAAGIGLMFPRKMILHIVLSEYI